METLTQLKQFREQVYQSFGPCAAAQMDLLDAIGSQTQARSVAELSLEAVFRRTYHSVYRAIDRWVSGRTAERERLRLVAGYIPKPEQPAYWLFGTDTTSAPRQYARTLAERGWVYQPSVIPGNKPVTIGHRYSVLAHLPHRASGEPPWVVPLLAQRVACQETEDDIGLKQLARVMAEGDLPWQGAWCVHVGDTRYSTPDYLAQAARYPHLVTVSRLRSNRRLYRLPSAVDKRPANHPTWYGAVFKLNDPTTWHVPDEEVEFAYTSRRGRTYLIRVEAWEDMLMRGSPAAPMHDCPFRLVRITWLDETGQPTHPQPIWLLVLGQRRRELSLPQVQHAYAQRFDLEHFFRFGKQRLLLTAFQTPDLRREESWWQMVLLAYVQLWLARDLAHRLPRPWERYLPIGRAKSASPAQSQRAFGRVIQQFGSPAAAPKPRGYSPGRPTGTRLPPRPRLPVVKKTA